MQSRISPEFGTLITAVECDNVVWSFSACNSASAPDSSILFPTWTDNWSCSTLFNKIHNSVIDPNQTIQNDHNMHHRECAASHFWHNLHNSPTKFKSFRSFECYHNFCIPTALENDTNVTSILAIAVAVSLAPKIKNRVQPKFYGWQPPNSYCSLYQWNLTLPKILWKPIV